MLYFSVIIPVYQVEKYLAECIESVLCQTFMDYEIILIDDGSTDASPTICDEYVIKYPNVRVIHKKNEGAAAARNDGIKLADGKFVCFMDSDDWWNDIRFLEKANNMLEKYKPEMLLFGMQKYSEVHDKICRKYYENLDILNNLPINRALKHIVETDKFAVSPCSRILSKEFLISNYLFFDKKADKAEDIEWAFRIYSKNPKIAGMNECPYVYRVRPDSVCTTKMYSGWWKSRFTSVMMAFQHIVNSKCSVEYKNLLFRALSQHYYILLGQIALEPIEKVKVEAFESIKKLSVLQNYKGGNKTNLARLAVKIFGVQLGAKILSIRLAYKRKKFDAKSEV